MTLQDMPTFDVRDIPFSRRGSWINLSPVTGLHTRAEDIHLVSHVTGMHSVLSLIPTRGGIRLETAISCDPASLVWDCGDRSSIRAAFESESVVRVVGHGAELTIADAADVLTPFTGVYFYRDPVDGSHVFTSYETGRRYRVTVIAGQLTSRGTERLGAGGRSVTVSGTTGWEIAIEELTAASLPYKPQSDFTSVLAQSAQDFSEYVEAIAGWRTAGFAAVELAVYVLWSATVSPAGFLERESILMSKHWMDKVWSWDHAFNAIAVAPGLPDMALDQFLAPFDHQDESGALPDSITHSEVLYNFVKPPIHGWAFERVRERLPRKLAEHELRDVYEKLARWSHYWLDYRTMPGHQLPAYHHGNDSGWDNSAAFDTDRVIESPDLAAFLIIQLDVLHALANELGESDAEKWRRESDRIHRSLLAELHDGKGFFATGAFSGAQSKRSSLLTLLPVLAADRLPPEIGEELAAAISRHLTAWGLATQLTESREYESDGYWRGPIWAPSTLLAEDGLRRAGFGELADVISTRFRALCERSGFAENFDAITGAGLRDRAYTWTASVYLILAHDEVERRLSSALSDVRP